MGEEFGEVGSTTLREPVTTQSTAVRQSDKQELSRKRARVPYLWLLMAASYPACSRNLSVISEQWIAGKW